MNSVPTVTVCAGPIIHSLKPGGAVYMLRATMSEYEPDYVNKHSIATMNGKIVPGDYITQDGDTILFHFARVGAEEEVA